MNNLIYRQAAIDGFYEMASDIDHLCTVDDYILFLESLPAANPEPQKMGRWIHKGDPLMIKCGNCGYSVMRYNNTPYCPNCGAKMEKIYDYE